MRTLGNFTGRVEGSLPGNSSIFFFISACFFILSSPDFVSLCTPQFFLQGNMGRGKSFGSYLLELRCYSCAQGTRYDAGAEQGGACEASTLTRGLSGLWAALTVATEEACWWERL